MCIYIYIIYIYFIEIDHQRSCFSTCPDSEEHLIIVTELLRDNLYEFSKYNRECGTLDADREILPDKTAVRRGNVFDNERTV